MSLNWNPKPKINTLSHALSYNLIEYFYFNLPNKKVQINKKTTTATIHNARSYRENTKCLINVNQQKVRIKEIISLLLQFERVLG